MPCLSHAAYVDAYNDSLLLWTFGRRRTRGNDRPRPFSFLPVQEQTPDGARR